MNRDLSWGEFFALTLGVPALVLAVGWYGPGLARRAARALRRAAAPTVTVPEVVIGGPGEPITVRGFIQPQWGEA